MSCLWHRSPYTGCHAGIMAVTCRLYLTGSCFWTPWSAAAPGRARGTAPAPSAGVAAGFLCVHAYSSATWSRYSAVCGRKKKKPPLPRAPPPLRFVNVLLVRSALSRETHRAYRLGHRKA